MATLEGGMGGLHKNDSRLWIASHRSLNRAVEKELTRLRTWHLSFAGSEGSKTQPSLSLRFLWAAYCTRHLAACWVSWFSSLTASEQTACRGKYHRGSCSYTVHLFWRYCSSQLWATNIIIIVNYTGDYFNSSFCMNKIYTFFSSHQVSKPQRPERRSKANRTEILYTFLTDQNHWSVINNSWLKRLLYGNKTPILLSFILLRVKRFTDPITIVWLISWLNEVYPLIQPQGEKQFATVKNLFICCLKWDDFKIWAVFI